MNILFLPENIASMPATTAHALNEIPGIVAKCITRSVHQYQSVNSEVMYFPVISKRKPIKWLINRILQRRQIKKMINWADVIHYTWGPVYKNGDDLAWARKKEKTIIIEWIGSDIRNPEYLKSINKYYATAYENGYEYKDYEGAERSSKAQKLFSKYGAIPFACPEIGIYIDKALFKQIYTLYQRIDLNTSIPTYPKVENEVPLIVHAPTAKIAKGSNYIVKVINELLKEYKFDFLLLNDVPREEVLKVMKKADIFLDQLIIGSYGAAAMEAMSYGKPVMCHIMAEVFQNGLSSDCPIVNTNPDNLKQKLIELINDSHLRNEIGRKSRLFVERYHDANKNAELMVMHYKMELQR